MTTETIEQSVETLNDDETILCMIDNAKVHSIKIPLREKYPETWTLDKYKEKYPDAPLLSPKAARLIEERSKKGKNKAIGSSTHDEQAKTVGFFAKDLQRDGIVSSELTKTQQHFHEVFQLGNAALAFTTGGNPISISVFCGHTDIALDYLPTPNDNYVYDIDLLKDIIVGFEISAPIYLWGMHGTGKTTILQQAAARTGRPFVRVQHTMNMQESDVLGQWTVRDGSTYYQPGPLIMAMMNGWVYCADEYDFAMPAVAAVYQPVLEGQNLIVKDAPSHYRRIVPHPEFRFVATGNTNGTGDETGLYAGTQIMNAANFSRFEITREVKYMSAEHEMEILISQMKMMKDDARRFVEVANTVREAFSEGKISTTISTRELISSARLGIIFGGKWLKGLDLAFCSRLSRVDAETVKGLIQRVFGS